MPGPSGLRVAGEDASGGGRQAYHRLRRQPRRSRVVPPMLGEFRAFLLKTNALALAIGVIIGGALGTVVNSLVNDIIMPPVGLVLGGSTSVSSNGSSRTQRRAPILRPRSRSAGALSSNAIVAFIVIAFV